MNEHPDQPNHPESDDAIEASSQEVPASGDAWTAGPSGVDAPSGDAYRVAADAFDPPTTDPDDHWAPPQAEHAIDPTEEPREPATAVVPASAAASNGAPRRGRQFLAGIALGALGGGVVGGGGAEIGRAHV